MTLDQLKKEAEKYCWQDISTAPKDGTDILIFWPHWSDKPEIGRYDTSSCASNKWAAPSCLSDTPYTPTHWRPLDTPDNDIIRNLLARLEVMEGALGQ
jgi:hypothetical protein